jgi:hypothetical protein
VTTVKGEEHVVHAGDDPLVNFTATDEAPGSMTQEEWDAVFRRARAQFPQPLW